MLLRGGAERIGQEPDAEELSGLPSGDLRIRARDCLVLHNQRLVHSLIRPYLEQGLDYEDLFQVGVLGLMRAARKFDPAMGNKFSTYATWWVRQQITRAIADEGALIRIPVHMHEQTAPTPPATRDFALRETTLGLAGETAAPWAGLSRRFGRIALADRLREVRALSGFTRVSPDATVVPADTARRLRWLPAVEVFGEGIFLTLDKSELAAWEADTRVGRRVCGMRADLDRSFQKDRLETLTGPELSPRFVLLHTLAHLLIRQLSFESGYTTASLVCVNASTHALSRISTASSSTRPPETRREPSAVSSGRVNRPGSPRPCSG
ncbi:sigma-70 family RNA polymerase sigma factor [Streptomyces gilvifuscus]|uniref:Sigma-70 family RNA polymerase sigma factor n=1 Tax=Streptomyces gilvifuscus TaxID=1550617 RepID=A0ABT5FKH3_9ACTN|nr:sigma-70 family RNA polymerase sigma factor [Streptomyces gilvifuscus]MDC2953002.1 sigma-70 family RNA polymerase sigma factor [Streptomyces gilvifuscus]